MKDGLCVAAETKFEKRRSPEQGPGPPGRHGGAEGPSLPYQAPATGTSTYTRFVVCNTVTMLPDRCSKLQGRVDVIRAGRGCHVPQPAVF